jgi:hypothetical protein
MIPPDSNVKSESRRQYPKQDLQIAPMEEGIQIDCSDEQNSKADGPSIETLHPDSNVKVESFPQDMKQNPGMALTDELICTHCTEQIRDKAVRRKWTCRLSTHTSSKVDQTPGSNKHIRCERPTVHSEAGSLRRSLQAERHRSALGGFFGFIRLQ